MAGFKINACPLVLDRLKSPLGQVVLIFHLPVNRRSFMLLFHVKSTPGRCLRSLLARWTGALTVNGKFRKRENLV